jgi:hypothetical protein
MTTLASDEELEQESQQWHRFYANRIRVFETGATRNLDGEKPDYEAFLSPLVIKRFGEYMHSHRLQKDGTMRSGDNWQKGIPLDSYMKSAWRHFHTWWWCHREGVLEEDALCALLFNVQGYLHELLKRRYYERATATNQ